MQNNRTRPTRAPSSSETADDRSTYIIQYAITGLRSLQSHGVVCVAVQGLNIQMVPPLSNALSKSLGL